MLFCCRCFGSAAAAPKSGIPRGWSGRRRGQGSAGAEQALCVQVHTESGAGSAGSHGGRWAPGAAVERVRQHSRRAFERFVCLVFLAPALLVTFISSFSSPFSPCCSFISARSRLLGAAGTGDQRIPRQHRGTESSRAGQRRGRAQAAEGGASQTHTQARQGMAPLSLQSISLQPPLPPPLHIDLRSIPLRRRRLGSARLGAPVKAMHRSERSRMLTVLLRCLQCRAARR